MHIGMPRLVLAGAMLAAGGYGFLAVANLYVAAAMGSGALGGISLAYKIGALGDVLVGVGLFLAFFGIAGIRRP